MNKIVYIITVCIVFIILIITSLLSYKKPEVAKNLYPEFQTYKNYLSLELYKSVGFDEDENQKIEITEKLKKELFEILKNNLRLEGSGRFLSTNHYVVIIDVDDNISFKFDILRESNKRTMIILNSHDYKANEVLDWFIRNRIK